MIKKINKTLIIFDNSITKYSKFNTGIQRTVRNLEYYLDGKSSNYYEIKFSPINESFFDREIRPNALVHSHVKMIFFHIIQAFRNLLIRSFVGRFFSFTFFIIQTIWALITYKIKYKNFIFVFSDSNWTNRGYCYLFLNQKVFANKNYAIFYDIGPYVFPQFFDAALVKKYKKFWYKARYLINNYYCISKFVADETSSFFNIDKANYYHFKLGGDIVENKNIFYDISCDKYNNYIVLGSIEPRKNNKVIYDAFNELLNQEKKISKQVRLIFVYNNTWKSEKFIKKIKGSKFYNKNIFLVKNASDLEVNNLIEASYALINASHYEGFGLSVQEALNKHKKVFCSSIPVFRELYSSFVIFFDEKNHHNLKEKIYDDLINSSNNLKKYKPYSLEISSNDLLKKIENEIK